MKLIHCPSLRGGILREKAFKLKLSGNKVYFTACSLQGILKKSCSKLHYQNVFNLKAFSHKIRRDHLHRAGYDPLYFSRLRASLFLPLFSHLAATGALDDMSISTILVQIAIHFRYGASNAPREGA